MGKRGLDQFMARLSDAKCKWILSRDVKEAPTGKHLIRTAWMEIKYKKQTIISQLIVSLHIPNPETTILLQKGKKRNKRTKSKSRNKKKPHCLLEMVHLRLFCCSSIAPSYGNSSIISKPIESRKPHLPIIHAFLPPAHIANLYLEIALNK
jgi:hypothetical protein